MKRTSSKKCKEANYQKYKSEFLIISEIICLLAILVVTVSYSIDNYGGIEGVFTLVTIIGVCVMILSATIMSILYFTD